MAGPIDPAVAAVFDACPSPVRRQLVALRRLILDTAAALPGVGVIEETLKWGQPSYLTPSGSGTTIRIDGIRGEATGYALYVNCRTGLVDRYRELYPQLRFSGNRALLFDAGRPLPSAEIRHCIALALTYHRDRKKAVRASRGA